MSHVKCFAAFAIAMCGLAPAVSAHVVIKDFEARAGYNEILTLIVPHGCGAGPTTEIRVKVPDGIATVVPQPQPGWETSLTRRKLDKPIAAEGGRMIADVPDEIVWKGGNLPSNQLGLFNILANMPDKVGMRLYFKTVQKCTDGETKWIETIADSDEMWRVWLKPTPAPFVVLNAAPPQLGADMATIMKARKEMDANKPK